MKHSVGQEFRKAAWGWRSALHVAVVTGTRGLQLSGASSLTRQARGPGGWRPTEAGLSTGACASDLSTWCWRSACEQPCIHVVPGPRFPLVLTESQGQPGPQWGAWGARLPVPRAGVRGRAASVNYH